MYNYFLAFAVMLTLLSSTGELCAKTQSPISLHPANPTYFLFRGKPTVLVTSAEHYGAVLNLDFDWSKYLRELKRCDLNYTRVFTGSYCENPEAFNIPHNTLAPSEGKSIAPWARSEQAGYAGGGNKFDLNKFNPEYFKRLKSFLKEAGRLGIVVEVTLFCPFYNDSMWKLSPMNTANNINNMPVISSQEAYNLQHSEIQLVQDKMTAEIVRQLNDFDNLFFEICNEPYFGGVTLDWQRHIATVIKETEAKLPKKHLIAQNIANNTLKVDSLDPQISIMNFHYAYPPVAIEQNRKYNLPIGCDETGFRGRGDSPYLEEGWEFMLAGGALYNNLDYSFTVTNPDGTAIIEPPTPGGGGKKIREGLSALKRFLFGFDFVKMQPDKSVTSDANLACRALSEPGKQYAVYVRGGSKTGVKLDLPKNTYKLRWSDPSTGKLLLAENIVHPGGTALLHSPEYASQHVALSVKASGAK